MRIQDKHPGSATLGTVPVNSGGGEEWQVNDIGMVKINQ
jgi:hypothetical protein